MSMCTRWLGLWAAPSKRPPPAKNTLRSNDPATATCLAPQRAMTDALSIMFWPLIACLLLPGILVYYGLHIVRREIIFVDLALAQVAALGICLSILLKHDAGDWQTYAWSPGFTFVGAAIFTLSRTADHRVPQAALIGSVFVVAAATAILLLSQSAEGDEELKRTLV